MRAQEAQADYQKEMASINAEEARRQGERMIKQGNIDAIKTQKKFNQILGSQRAGFASQGVEVDSGSAKLVQEETMQAAIEETRSIRNNAFLQAMGFQAEADDRLRNARFAQSGARSSGAQTLLAGGLSAADTANKYGYFDKKR
jgi:hypothetical protein